MPKDDSISELNATVTTFVSALEHLKGDKARVEVAVRALEIVNESVRAKRLTGVLSTCLGTWIVSIGVGASLWDKESTVGVASGILGFMVIAGGLVVASGSKVKLSEFNETVRTLLPSRTTRNASPREDGHGDA